MRLRRASDATGRRAPSRGDREGFVIVAVLIVVVILSLAAYRFTDLMTAEYRAAARSEDAAQARYAARSAVHYAAAMLSDPDSLANDLGGNPFAENAFQTQVVRSGAVPRQEARFAFVAVVPDGSGGYKQQFGCVLDETGKLNINALIQVDSSGQVLYNALMALNLPNLTSDIADAIVDWVDGDDDPRDGGAESDFYISQSQPYRAKNGPLNSLDELLLVKGVTPQILYGNDRNRNGISDDDPSGGTFDRGLADYLTVYGREINLNSQGVLRINVNDSDDLPTTYQNLSAVLPQELADFIMAYKLFTTAQVDPTMTMSSTTSGGADQVSQAVQTALSGAPTNKNRVTSLCDLMTAQVTLPADPTAPAGTMPTVVPSPLLDQSKAASMLAALLDNTTTLKNVELPPRVNVNSAGREVIGAIPGMTSDEADAIIAQRDAQSPTDPATITGAWLLTSGAVSQATYRSISNYVTGRTMVYRVQAIGYFGQGGPVARVEAVIDTNQGAPRILYYRDLTDLDTPRGFEPQR
ncbi:MAG TPA: hypothetical protein VH092_23150 [Urbifossiella sp.]|jgi:DNA uptake protein ComE-like DNA-binding protein|nr:hypothetical protein [Urbifossiella sp.]